MKTQTPSAFGKLKSELEPEVASKVYFNLRQSFFLGIPRVFTISAASALFLESYEASHIPYAYLASAVGVTFLGFLFLRIERASGHIQSALWFTVFMTIMTITLRLGFEDFMDKALLSFILFVWAEAEWTLTNVIFWSVANNSFTVREAKKLFGIISAGEIVPLIVGGAIVPIFVSELGVINLLYFSILGYAAAWTNLLIHRNKSSEKREEAPQRVSGKKKGILAKKRKNDRKSYIYQIGFLLTFNCILFYFVDNLFLEEAQAQMPSADELASFMGLFVFAVGLFQLITKVFLSSRLTKSWGIRKTLLVTPAAILLFMSLALFLILADASSNILFYIVVCLKLVERTLASGINNPAYYVLFQPLAQDARNKAQGFLDTIVTQGASLVGGGMLLIIQEQLELGIFGIVSVGIVLLLGWLLVSHTVGLQYTKALRMSIHRRQFASSDLLTVDQEVQKILEEGIYSQEPVQVTYSLRLLNQIDQAEAAKHFLKLIQHDSDEVRSLIVELMDTSGSSDMIAPLKTTLESSMRPEIVKDTLLALGACSKEQSVHFIEEYLDANELVVQDAAVIGLLRYAGVEGALRASPKLVKLSESSKVEERIRGTNIIGEAKSPSLFRTLAPLLHDTNLRVRRSAIFAAGKIKTPKIAPEVLKSIDSQELRGPVANALVSSGPEVIPALIEVYNSTDLRWSSRREILRIAGRIGTKSIVPFLLDAIQKGDNDLRSAALQALSESVEYDEHSEETIGFFRQLLTEEAKTYHEILAFQRDLKLGPDTLTLVHALESELVKGEHRIYLLLENLYGRLLISSIQVRLRSDSRTSKALAFELLENTLNTDNKTAIIAILDAQSSVEKLSLLDNIFPRKQTQDWAICLALIISKPLDWKTTWIVTCCRALSIANNIPIIESQDEDSQSVAGTLSLMVNKGTSKEDTLVNRTLTLGEMEYFTGLTMDRLGALCSQLTLTEYGPGDAVVRAGEPLEKLAIIFEGILASKTSRYPAGSVIGEFSIFNKSTLTETIVAETASRVAFLELEQIQSLMTEQYSFAWHLLELVCTRLQPTSQTRSRPLSNFSPLPSDEKISDSNKSLFELAMLLRAVPLFMDLDDLVLSDVIYATTEVFYEPGEQIFAQGKEGTSMLIILEGSAQVHAGSQAIATVSAPNIIGEISAITAAPRSASVVATSQLHCLILDQIELYTLLWQQNEVIKPLLRVLSGRLEQNLASGQVINRFSSVT